MGQDPYAVTRGVALARVAATALQLRTPVVISHASAALLWALPAPTTQPVHVIQRTKPCGRSHGLERHTHRLGDTDVVTLGGLAVTQPVRTVIDCAGTLGARAALVVADAALHAGVDRAACIAMLAEMPGARGIVQARAVLELADDGAESPGESSARFALLAAGLPRPETQVRVETHLGCFWSDLGWPEWRLLAEYDGRGKYEARGSATDAVLAEKRRQDAIEEAGYRVMRITKDDLRTPGRLAARVIRAAPPGALRLPLTPRGVLAEPSGGRGASR